MGRTPGALLFSVLIAAAALPRGAHAYTPTIAPNGAPVRWKQPNHLNLAGNPTNQSGIGDADFYAAVVRGLQRWQAAAGGSAAFDYWQGRDPAVYSPSSDYNGLSSIYFSSNAPVDSRLSPNVLGLTQVWYNTDTGEILETDVVLNDRDFHFTTNPKDTSGYGSNASSGRSNVFIENVITHELGHAFGLSHAGGLQSTMLFMESPEQAHLGCDDQVAIRALYPAQDADVRGSISGTVISEAGGPLFGAHVLAISRRRGTVLATALTDKSGRYTVSALEAGTYFLFVEPFLAGPQALPSYYAGISAGICPGGEPYGRSALTEADGVSLRPVTAPTGGGVVAPAITVHCGSFGGASISGAGSTSSASTAPAVFEGLTESGFGTIDRFGYGGKLYYRLHSVAGHLELHAVSYSLYSPVHPTLDLLDAAGASVPAQIQDQVYLGDSGYVNFDSALTADDLPPGDYTVAVSGSPLGPNYYPAGPILLDSIPFVLLTGSMNEADPPLAASLATNARCRMAESFAAYTSPPGNPPRRLTSSSSGGGFGFCGTVAAVGEGAPGPKPPAPGAPNPGGLIGWLLPWLFMGASARYSRARLR